MDANNREPNVNAHGVAAEPDVVPSKVPASLFAVLAVTAIVAAIVVWVFFRALEGRAEKKDRAEIAEAGLERPQDAIPPAPRLQIHPVANWREYRIAEDARLSSYGWMDRSAGAVHVPVDRAMEIVLQRGVGPLPPSPVVVPEARALKPEATKQ
jgi:hypothetical protein